MRATSQGDLAALQREVREFVADHLTDGMRADVLASGTYHDPSFAVALGGKGWVVPTYGHTLKGEPGWAACNRASSTRSSSTQTLPSTG